MSAKPIQLVVICITIVTMSALLLGAWLAYTGHEAGTGILFSTGSGGLGGMIALLSSTRATPSSADGSTKVEVSNTKDNPVKTEETKTEKKD